mgnify:CR=1 FL=1|jgi:uroporphyrinogen decarboxylase
MTIKKLIDYIMKQNKRLVSPKGGGSIERFQKRVNTPIMKPAEYIAHWLAFQAEEYGHEFLCSTMLDVQICKCLGLQTYLMPDGSEHVVEYQINCANDLNKIKKTSPLAHPLVEKYITCITEFKKICTKPVGGACFGPFTCAGTILGTQHLCMASIDNPELIKKTMEITTDFILQMALDCEKAGADFFWIAEPTGVLFAPQQFNEFCGRYIKKIFDSISVPGFLHIPGNTNHLIDAMIKTNAQCLSLDSFVDMRDMAHRVPLDLIILGNINSVSMLYDPIDKIAQDTAKLNREIKNFPNFVISSGGGLSKDTPEENLKVLFDTTRKIPVWNREQYLQIHQLWRIMAAKSFAEIDLTLAKNNYSPDIVAASLEEACMYLKRQYKYKNLSLPRYSRQSHEILKLLCTDYISRFHSFNIESDTVTLEQLKANMLHIAQGFVN